MEMVSIIVPIYNMGNRIENCVNSLLKQTYSNIEIILVDDGSTDNSLEVCNLLAERDERIKVYHKENQGSGPARNYGIEKASGRYVCFPDADDTYSYDAVTKMVSAMQNGVQIVNAGYQEIGTNGKCNLKKIYADKVFSGEYVRSHYDEFMNISQPFSISGAPWNKLYDMEIIRKYNIKYPPLRRHQDTGFICRYLTYVDKIAFISPVVYTYYRNDLKREWYKYPINYIDAVVGLYEIYQETVRKWNIQNEKTILKINQGHISNTIKSMELTFSPKVKYSIKEKKSKIIEIIEKSRLFEIEIPDFLGKYQKLVYHLLLNKQFNLAIFIMYIKITAEKSGILQKIKH